MIRGFFPFGLKGRMEKMAASIRRGRRRRGSLEGEKTSTLFLPPQTKITRINVKGRGRGENGWLFSLSENRWSFIVCRGIVKTSNLPPPPPGLSSLLFRNFSPRYSVRGTIFVANERSKLDNSWALNNLLGVYVCKSSEMFGIYG